MNDYKVEYRWSCRIPNAKGPEEAISKAREKLSREMGVRRDALDVLEITTEVD